MPQVNEVSWFLLCILCLSIYLLFFFSINYFFFNSLKFSKSYFLTMFKFNLLV